MKNKIKNWINEEFIAGYTWFDYLFMGLMVLTQIVVFILYPDSWLNIVAGLSGVISVVLCAKCKISFYFIGFIQTFTYLALAWQNRFYGEVMEQFFYIGTMIWGIYVWKKNSVKEDNGAKHVVAKTFNCKQWIGAIAVTLVATLALGTGLINIGSAQAYKDAFTNIAAIVAQLLMVWGYREQWIWWLLIDITCTIMWALVGNWSMVAMYVAWTINCVYGWYQWTKTAKTA